MVKIVVIFLDRRARFVVIYDKEDDIRAAALVAAWMAGSLFIKGLENGRLGQQDRSSGWPHGLSEDDG